jgi:hypothetical protein
MGTARNIPATPSSSAPVRTATITANGMELDTTANEAWVNHKVLDQPEHPKKPEGPENEQRRVEGCDDRRDNRQQKRPDERDEFQDTREHAEQHRIRNLEHGKPEPAQAADSIVTGLLGTVWSPGHRRR